MLQPLIPAGLFPEWMSICNSCVPGLFMKKTFLPFDMPLSVGLVFLVAVMAMAPSQVQAQDNAGDAPIVEAFDDCGIPATASCYQEVLDRHLVGKYQDVYAVLARLCANGSGHACAATLQAFDAGITDPDMMLDNYRLMDSLCFGKDMVDACSVAGWHVQLGKGVNLPRYAATPYFEKACEADKAPACLQAGRNHLNQGQGSDNINQAAALFVKTCQLGHQEGCKETSKLYGKDFHWKKHSALLLRLLDEACRVGPAACANLAELYLMGLFVPESQEKALKYGSRACDNDIARGCNVVGALWSQDMENRKSREMALEFLGRACGMDHITACMNRGRMLTMLEQYGQAIADFEKACQFDIPEACYAAGALLFEGHDPSRPEKTLPRSLMEKACYGQHYEACNDAGWAIEQTSAGIGDMHSALTLYQMACDHGQEMGCGNALRLHFNEAAQIQIPVAASVLDHAKRQCFEQVEGDYCNTAAEMAILYPDKVENIPARIMVEKGCTAGHEQSCYTLAVMLRDGMGGRTDLTRALALFAKTCAEDRLVACHNQAQILERPDYPGHNLSEARKLYQPLCDNDFAMSCHNIGSLLVDDNHPDTYAYFQKACSLGYTNSCHVAGQVLAQGIGIPMDPAKAELSLIDSCALDQALSCRLLGDIYVEGLIGEPDLETARAFFEKGCQLENAISCASVGYVLIKAAVSPEEYQEAARISEQGCENNVAFACSNLAVMHDEGYLPNPDEAKTRRLFHKACQLRDDRGCLGVSLYMLEGWGGPKAIRDGRRSLNKACRLNNQRACDILNAAEALEQTGKKVHWQALFLDNS